MDKKIKYKGYYIYKNDKIPIEIENDGETLSFSMYGIRFEGDEFSAFKTTEKLEGEIVAHIEQWNCLILNLDKYESFLCNCTFEIDIPQVLINKSDGQSEELLLHVQYALGEALPKGGLNKELLTLTINLKGKTYTAQAGWFEDAFDQLMKEIGNSYYFQNCYGCLYSDYSIYGQAPFGGMQCYYDNKENYLKAANKTEFTDLNGYKFVQETYVCDKFKKREPGTGYRG